MSEPSNRLEHPLSFGIAFLLVPVIILSALVGSWTVLLPPVVTWYLFGALDFVVGRYTGNPDPLTSEKNLFWHRFVTMLWVPVQFILLLWILWYVPRAEHLIFVEKLFVVGGSFI